MAYKFRDIYGDLITGSFEEMCKYKNRDPVKIQKSPTFSQRHRSERLRVNFTHPGLVTAGAMGDTAAYVKAFNLIQHYREVPNDNPAQNLAY